MSHITPLAPPIWAFEPIVTWGGDRRMTTNGDKITDSRRSRYADLGCDHAMRADLHVVRHLNEVIEFCSFADNRRPHRSTIDRGIGSNFDIIFDYHAADLGNFDVPPFKKGEPKAILANRSAGMNNNAVANNGVCNRGVGSDIAILPDPDAGSDYCVRSDTGEVADARAWANECTRINRDAMPYYG